MATASLSRPSRPIKGMFLLAAVATSLPIASEYTMAYSLMIWLLVTRGWRLALVGRRSVAMVAPAERASLAAFAEVIRPLHWGILAYLVSHFVAAFGSYWTSEFSPGFGEVVHTQSHQVLKLGIEWIVLSSAMAAATRRGWCPTKLGPLIFGWFCVYFVYCLVQHYTGIDWTHGLHARLGENRFAYGVYRVSGFMGHPLSFAYNMMLILLAALALVVQQGDRLPVRGHLAWWGVALVVGLTLLISGSRFVLLVIAATLALCEGPRLRRHWRYLLGLAAAVAVVLAVEGSVIGRFGELFDEKVPILVRFPRLVFWRIHWQMFLDHPLFGTGLAGTDKALRAYYTAAVSRDNMYQAHNMILQSLADTGLVGFLGLTSFLLGLVIATRRLKRWRQGRQGFSYLVVATLLTGLMQNNLRDSDYLYALWFLLSLLLAQATLASGPTLDPNERESPQNLRSPARDADPAPDLPG